MDNSSVCRDGAAMLRRIFHWGPLITLSIIFFVSFVTFSCSVHAFVSSTSGALGILQLFFLIGMLFTILRSYFSSLFIGPGFVPLNWKPTNPEAESRLQFCRVCAGYKPPRAHHCRSCKRCVMKMDHHCPWINTCCGHLNHGHFLIFVLSASIGCFGCALVLGPMVYRTFTNLPNLFFHGSSSALASSIYMLIVITFALGLALGVWISVGILAVYQLIGIRKNQTAIETWIVEKAVVRRRESTLSPFVYPYDLGKWNNMRQVLSWSGQAVGDGIHWAVRPGCGQFDLTMEQIRQKKIKQLLRREYQVTEGYTGRRCPCCKFGYCTACHAPCPNEQCLRIQPGDTVLVTRWSKYWFYGDLKLDCSDLVTSQSPVENPRGWFPARCVLKTDSSRRGNATTHIKQD